MMLLSARLIASSLVVVGGAFELLLVNIPCFYCLAPDRGRQRNSSETETETVVVVVVVVVVAVLLRVSTRLCVLLSIVR